MKIFQSIQVGGSGPKCEECAFFQNDPALVEDAYPGLTAMSSGFASVRDRDGLCNHHQLYLSARDSCPHFEARQSGDSRVETHEKRQSSSLQVITPK
jgi:hypothetical protein